MKFFKPEDFHELRRLHGGPFQQMGEYEAIAHIANEEIEKAGMIVYGYETTDPRVSRFWQDEKHLVLDTAPIHKAILINIEEINICKHPKEKVIELIVETWNDSKKCSYKKIEFVCSCTVKVKPAIFEESR